MVEQQQQRPRFRFSRPKAKASNVAEGEAEAEAGACSPRPSPSPNLYVANCGPAVGLSFETIASAFAAFGQVTGVHPADDTGARVVVSFSQSSSAQAALKALHNGSPCPQLGGRILHIQYSLLLPTPPPHPHCDPHHPLKVQHQAYASVVSSSVASDLGIPGIYLLHDFVTPAQEQELLSAVDARPWKSLAKRRVQHYGFEFLYKTRNVDPKQFLGDLPSFVSFILEKISLFPDLSIAESNIVDQLTVNEYPPGVGLSPHIDTHSAFDRLIFSLSLAGPCIMEFRKYPQGTWLPLPSERENSDHCSNVERRAIFLPPRSMLLLSGEARYAWHHYIPHHKVDMVDGLAIRRGSRRVSFTFRKVRTGPCCCDFPEYCDSQMG
eukprot:TRINITY_DN6842_c0_g1_i10.p1 TRINITY_DN6842_c0_g1~~TRINITY_DN6842_c0_g1_i10.p1  ORF type:complete len:380 (-),score=65.01 TRINITY_DN6842_c0_g1_i10:826-1965(-)